MRTNLLFGRCDQTSCVMSFSRSYIIGTRARAFSTTCFVRFSRVGMQADHPVVRGLYVLDTNGSQFRPECCSLAPATSPPRRRRIHAVGANDDRTSIYACSDSRLVWNGPRLLVLGEMVGQVLRGFPPVVGQVEPGV